MNINAIQAPIHYQKQILNAITLIYGNEILLNQEALDSARERAKIDGYNERRRIDAGKSCADWQQLLHEVESPSLFAPKSLIELHAESKSLDKTASNILKRIAELTLNNTRIILHLPNIEKPTGKPWFKALEKNDFLEIHSHELKSQEFEKQIQKRLHQKKLQLTPDALERFLDYHTGNLLAAQQSINRLTQYPEYTQKLNAEHIETRLDDFSHHNIFAFRNALLKCDWLTCYRIAQHIEQTNKKDIIPLNWFLAKDIIILLQLQASTPSTYPQIFQTSGIVHWKQKEYQHALTHFSQNLLNSLLSLSAKLDRISKGAEAGDSWLTLRQYCLLRVK